MEQTAVQYFLEFVRTNNPKLLPVIGSVSNGDREKDAKKISECQAQIAALILEEKKWQLQQANYKSQLEESSRNRIVFETEQKDQETKMNELKNQLEQNDQKLTQKETEIESLKQDTLARTKETQELKNELLIVTTSSQEEKKKLQIHELKEKNAYRLTQTYQTHLKYLPYFQSFKQFIVDSKQDTDLYNVVLEVFLRIEMNKDVFDGKFYDDGRSLVDPYAFFLAPKQDWVKLIWVKFQKLLQDWKLLTERNFDTFREQYEAFGEMAFEQAQIRWYCILLNQVRFFLEINSKFARSLTNGYSQVKLRSIFWTDVKKTQFSAIGQSLIKSRRKPPNPQERITEIYRKIKSETEITRYGSSWFPVDRAIILLPFLISFDWETVSTAFK